MQTKGARFSDSLHPLKVADQLYDTYDWDEFTVANGTTNYDVSAQQSAMFSNVPRAWLAIIDSDQDVTIRFNSTDNPAINHEVIKAPWEWRNILEITNMYITNNSGSTVNIKVFLA